MGEVWFLGLGANAPLPFPPSLPPSRVRTRSPPLPSLPSLALPSCPSSPLSLRSRPPYIQECCKLPQRRLRWSPSRNRIWCILALKYDIWRQRFRWFSRNCTNHRNHNQNIEDFSRFLVHGRGPSYFLNGPTAAPSIAPALIGHWVCFTRNSLVVGYSTNWFARKNRITCFVTSTTSQLNLNWVIQFVVVYAVEQIVIAFVKLSQLNVRPTLNSVTQ